MRCGRWSRRDAATPVEVDHTTPASDGTEELRELHCDRKSKVPASRWSRREDVHDSHVTGLPEFEKLHEHVSVSPAGPALPPKTVTCRYIWKNAEHTLSCPADGGDDVAGALPSAPSGALRDYEDKLKAIKLQQKGMERADIARTMGRSEHWVKRWWKLNPHQIQKPDVRHGVLVRNAPVLSFRDLELRRGFAVEREPASADVKPLVAELFEALSWEPARRATRHPETGELRVRFDP
eukprot:TRINITY_DN83049_c0_g1_i1.p1 TRINITY_DN83049_c0_g1~~TRINITY_DN83049_c0_g1_i1.p1  ORF type:complete len:237 (+),score=38.29 TRINITY_DN83049_c0_g1_i1:161-871(+)